MPTGTTAEKIARTSAETGRLASRVDRARGLVDDTLEAAAHEARRVAKRGRRALDDAGEDFVHSVKKHPLQSVGISFGAGLVTGLALGLGYRACAKRSNE